MAFRVTVDDVKVIFETSLKADNIEAFIRGANVLINDNLTGKGLAADTLKEIERNVAASFASQMDPLAKSEKIGDVQNQYIFNSVDPYMNMAKKLDTTGILASLGKPVATLDLGLETRSANTGVKGGD